ncbi:MAG: hypothetical protein ACJ749_07080, partial [Flavisolibacter sp.]
MLATSKPTLLGLSALLVFLVTLFFYYFNFISVFLDEKNHIVLKKAGKEIEYLRINKIILLPIANRQLAGYYSIFALRYTNAKNKMATKFIS